MPASGVLSFDVDLSLATDDYDGSCNMTAKGKDLVFRLPFNGTSRVSVTASRPAGSLANPVLFLRSASCAGGVELACSDDPASPTAPETVSLVGKPAGDYFLFVEGRGANAGPTHIEVQVSPANDTCAAPTPLTFVGGIAATTGNTSLATNDTPAGASPTCSPTGASTGRDLVFQYTLSAAQDVTITATPSGPMPAYQPVVYVRKTGACASTAAADELGCTSTGGEASGTPAVVALKNQPPGVYFLFVDGAQSTAGAFALDVALSAPTVPPANDDCAGATAITFTGGIGSIAGNTSGASNSNLSSDPSPTCSYSATATGKDLVYKYTLTAAQDVTITATPSGSAPTFQPVVYARKSGQCASPASADELACYSTNGDPVGTPASIALVNQPAGTYFVLVDGHGDTAGPFTLDVVLAAPTLPPANDTCAAPVVLTVGGAARTGTTLQATNDYSRNSVPPYSSVCDTYSFSGNDVVYQFTPAASGTVHVIVTPSSTFDPAVMLLSGTCGAGACVAAEDKTFTGSAEDLAVTVVGGTTYFVVVDAYSSSASAAAGTFTIKVQ